MDVDLNKWFRCELDKREFKKLCKKSDWQGFKHMIIYFSFLGLFGYLAYATWGTWWSLLFFLIYGNIWGAVMLYGMKLGTELLLNQSFGMISFII